MTRLFVMLLVGLFSANVLAQTTPATAPALSGKLGEPVQLFNGMDLTGWTWFSPQGLPVEQLWTVKDGLLHCAAGPSGYIHTGTEFENYVLTVEQRHVKPGNGGILFAMTGPDKLWPKSLEIQGQSGGEGHMRGVADFKLNQDPARAVSRQLNRIGQASAKPVGEWDMIVITVDHQTVWATVNGVLQNYVTSNESLKGKIGLQSEGGEMEFRKIEMRPILGDAKN